MVCFFFSSRRRHTSWPRDWSSDVCSSDLGGVSGDGIRHWERYLTIPWKPLTTRSYDAIGFYSHLDETGTDPFNVFQSMWSAGSNSIDAFRVANADTETFLDSWPSGVLREPGRGSAWDTTGPGIIDDAYAPPSWTV